MSRVVRTFGLLLLLAAVGAGAFYGGMHYQMRHLPLTPSSAAPPSTESAQPSADPEAEFEKQRREVDKEPARRAGEMATENNGKPLESDDPQFLYLYGRALMLSGRHTEALDAFKRAIEKIKDRPARDPFKVEAKLSAAAAALKTGNWQTAQTAAKELDEVIEMENKTGAAPPVPGSSSSGTTSTTGTTSPKIPK
jgi:tetratricopeptide (TPR) repeat protein